jgi:hypothetical protein
MATDWAKKDKEHADKLIDGFIRWTNADDEGAITLGRESCCYIRDEIERLRKVETQYIAESLERDFREQR